jgi:phosphatidylserine decarboxylase
MFVALVSGAAVAVLAGSALARKWKLGVLRSALTLTVLAVAGALLLALSAEPLGVPDLALALVETGLTLGLGAVLVLLRFFRDPERTPPQLTDGLVSPADGEVIYVRRSERGELPVATKNGRTYRVEDLVRTPLEHGEAVAIGISLSFLDVHVNRAPAGGVITAVERHAGRFASLKLPEMAFENERATIVIQRPDLQIAIVLIASRLVRQIVTRVRAGQEVAMGDRLGMIRFGSQVDLVLPDRPGLRVVVGPGDRVVAGETVIVELRRAPAGAARTAPDC